MNNYECNDIEERLKEARSVLKLSYWNLKFVGIWCEPEKSKCQKLISQFSFTIAFFMISYFVIFAQTAKLFMVGGDLDIIVDILCIADVPGIISITKLVAIRYYSKDFRLLLRKFYDDWKMQRKFERQLTMNKNAQTSRNFALIIVILCFTTFTCFNVGWLLILLVKLSNDEKRFFIIKSYFPYDAIETPWFEMTWLLQGITAFLASTASTGFDSLFGVLVMHLCGQYELIKQDFIEIRCFKSRAGVKKIIAQIAQRHHQINIFSELVQKTFCWLLLVQILVIVLLLCLQGYQFFKFSLDTSGKLSSIQAVCLLVFISYITLDLYIFCYVAEQLQTKSMEVTNAAYSCQWYNLKANEVRDIMFIIKRSQIPVKLTAGKFFVLSLNLFSKVLKTSIGYLSILQAIKKKNIHNK